MCELFAMSSHGPSAVTYSLNEFAEFGSAVRHNRSGWGIAFMRDRDAFLVKEAEPAADSPWVRFISHQALESECVIAHVRLATLGANALRNTHPFRRALGRRTHVFAHNGTLRGLTDAHDVSAMGIQPVGETDSELAFCLLLERMRAVWRNANGLPSVEARMDVFAEFAADMAEFGPLNALYADTDVLFAHGHKRIWEEEGLDSPPRPPGLHTMCCTARLGPAHMSFTGLDIDLADRQTTLLASVPLDDEGWEPLPEGTALALKAGQEVLRVQTV